MIMEDLTTISVIKGFMPFTLGGGDK